jgi:hypothetical protein
VNYEEPQEDRRQDRALVARHRERTTIIHAAEWVLRYEHAEEHTVPLDLTAPWRRIDRLDSALSLERLAPEDAPQPSEAGR